MLEKIKLKLLKNKANGQLHITLPKKKFDSDTREILKKAKSIWFKIEGFE